MGIRVKKHKGSWWVFVSYHGRRKAKKIGTEKAARAVAAKLEVALALGDFSCLEGEAKDLVFSEYAQRTLNFKALSRKDSTIETYQYYLSQHILEVFGQRRLRTIKRDDIKLWLSDLARQKLAASTIRLALATLRGVLSAALEDSLITVNPASRLGSFTVSEKPPRKAQSMQPEEAQRFLESARDYCPDDIYPFFLIALRAGLRLGEILGLRWGDFQFGQEGDQNRYIFVQRRWYRRRRGGGGTYSTPKGNKVRRVDMTRELRRVLMELRDQKLLQAFEQGRESIAEDLVFPGQVVGHPLHVAQIDRYYQASLERAGLRRFHINDLRHTYGSLLILAKAPLPYVSSQMGHSSIKITADIYIHLIGSQNIQWADKLDDDVQPAATQLQPKIRDKIK